MRFTSSHCDFQNYQQMLGIRSNSKSDQKLFCPSVDVSPCTSHHRYNLVLFFIWLSLLWDFSWRLHSNWWGQRKHHGAEQQIHKSLDSFLVGRYWLIHNYMPYCILFHERKLIKILKIFRPSWLNKTQANSRAWLKSSILKIALNRW